MGALSTNISNEESILRSIEAGADILLLPIDVVNAIRSIKSAIESGRIKEERIDQSVEKIWNMKTEVGLFSEIGYPDLESISNVVDIKSHKKIADRIAQESITLVKDEKTLYQSNLKNK